MCIKINKINKQEVGIRFLPSTVTEKNILDRRKDRGKTVYPPPPSGSGGIIKW